VSFMVNWMEQGSPQLTSEARKYYRDRGVSHEVAKLNNLRSLRPEESARLFGKDCREEALLFPINKHYGTARLLERDKDKFRSTAGRGSRLYEPVLPESFGYTKRDLRADPKKPLVIGEGPTRALAMVTEGGAATALAGSWNWQKDRQPLPQLLQYEWRNREVIPIFDADITENNHVLLPYLLFGDWLRTQGADVQYLRIPPEKDDKKLGLDDFLKKYSRKKFEQLRREDWDKSEDLERLRLTALRTTEGGLASLFLLQSSGDVRYDNEEECWYVWSGSLWERQPSRAPDVQEAMKSSIHWIFQEAAKISNKDRRKSMLKWGSNCDRKAVIKGAIDLASSDKRIRVATEDLDQNAYLLGTKSGVVDLQRGRLLSGTREQLVTRSVASEFDKEADCPRWRKFVREIMMGDKEMVAFMQRFSGYLLLGGNPERLIFFLHGVGRNGKSVFIETLLKLFGDYGEPAKSEMIMKHRADRDSESAQPFMLKLRGKRYITASEVGQGMRLDAAVVKTLTGGDEITVRGLHAAPVRFTVEGKFVIRCNHRPIIEGGDQAIWDRIVEIPFELRLTEEEQDTALHAALLTELPGVLQWAIDGCVEYQKNGLGIPEKVRAQIKKYQEEMDSVSRWLDERVEKDTTGKMEASVAYANYEKWCGVNGGYPESRQEFKKRLTARGFQHKESNGKTWWRGIKVVLPIWSEHDR